MNKRTQYMSSWGDHRFDKEYREKQRISLCRLSRGSLPAMFFSLILGVMTISLQAQTISLERSVLANSGHLLHANEANASGRVLGFTLGEAIIGAGTQSNAYLEEGFWAGGIFITPMTSIGEGPYTNPRIQIYPNPAQIKVNIEGEAHLINSVQLYDVRGRLVLDQALQETQISVETLAEGVYQLLTRDVSGTVTGTFKLVKW